jgi:hypothetical protein
MRSTFTGTLDGRLYRAVLLLCPAGFRRDHGDEMVRDFDEARGEAAALGPAALWLLRLAIGLDLVRTCAIQWRRTGLPAIGLAAVLLPLAIVEGLAAVARHAAFSLPVSHPQDDEVLSLLLIAVVCAMVIATTIVLNLWVSALCRRRRPVVKLRAGQ